MKRACLAVLLVSAVATAAPPDDGPGWLKLGVERQRAGDLDGAIAAYDKALELRFAPPVVMYDLGTAYALKKQPDQAVEWLKKAAGAGFRDLQTIANDHDLDGLRNHPRWPEVTAAFEQAAHPCVSQPIHHQLDFWVGEWEVFAPRGYHVGRSSVQRILGTCVVLESWSGDIGGHGQSFNFYDGARKRWRQTWVDDSGGNTDYVGDFTDGAMRFQAEGGGGPRRLTFFPLDGGRVRQLAETSSDGGKTWAVSYDFTYVAKK